MYAHFDQLAQYERFVVNTSGTTPDQVTDEVLRRFEAVEFVLE